MSQVWFDLRRGSFGFILRGWWLHIKAPWCEPLFSERYGYAKWRRAFGWRAQFRRIKELPENTSDAG